jgi:serine protease Do
MKTLTIAGVAVIAAVLAGSVYAQSRAPGSARVGPQLDRVEQGARDLMVLAGRGAEIGVQIAEGKDAGVVIEEVRPDSPAEKAGLKRADLIVEFDGEHVRSARQFGRLVQETPPGRTVKATIVRDGQKKEVQIAPQEGRGALSGGMMFDDGRLRERLGDLGRFGDRLPPFNFNFDFDLSGALSGRRLGVSVDELTDQLAQYFGAKDGVLVTAVTEGSAASRAGLKAGDVITSIDGQSVRSRDDLVRALRTAKDEEVSIAIVRDKKETSIKAKIEAPRRATRGARPA